MNKILELRNRRADLWNDAKKYLDEHRLEDGTLSKEDEEVYDKMEADVFKLNLEIERLERQAHIDYDIDSNKDSWEGKYLIDKENWEKMEQNLLNEINYQRELIKQKEIKIETLIEIIKIIWKEWK